MNKIILCVFVFMLLIAPVFSAAGVINQTLDDRVASIGAEGAKSTVLTNGNNPPNPPIITGPTSGRMGETYVYNVTLTDPDLDDVMFYLEVNFGDGTEHVDCGCGKSWQNGTILKVSHRWKKAGNYGITARVQDASGEWSEWSDPLSVSMPRNKELIGLHVLFSNKLMGHFPLLEKLTLLVKQIFRDR